MARTGTLASATLLLVVMAGCGATDTPNPFAGSYVLDLEKSAALQASTGVGNSDDKKDIVTSATAEMSADGMWSIVVKASVPRRRWSRTLRATEEVIEEEEFYAVGVMTKNRKWIACIGEGDARRARYVGTGGWTKDGNRYILRMGKWKGGALWGSTSGQYAEIVLNDDTVEVHLYGAGGLIGKRWRDDLHFAFRKE